MAQQPQSRGFFGFLTDKKVTYHRAVGKERKERKAEAMADRKERLAIQELRAKEKAAEAKIAAAEKKIDQSRDKIDAAKARESKGAISEAQLAKIKAHMEREIEAQKRFKEATLAKVSNPSWGYGVYQGTGFSTQQIAHFKSKPAAETWARSHGLKGYAIKRAFAKNPAVSGAQYRLAQAVLSGTQRVSSMPRKVAQEIIDQTPAALRSKYMMEPLTGRTNTRKKQKRNYQLSTSGPDWKPRYFDDKAFGKKVNELRERASAAYKTYERSGTTAAKRKADRTQRAYELITSDKGMERFVSNKPNRRNPAADAAALSEKFHGRKATTERRIVEPMHVHKHLMEIGDLVRLVIDTPTGKVVVLNFNTSDPRKIVRLATSEKDPKTGKIVGKQLYLRGGDQEVNLKALGMDSPLWIRDRMELGRLHEFKRGEEPLIVDGERVKGSITYRTRKGMDDFKLVDYWHKAGEETARKAGPAARSIVEYDYPNKKIGFIGGQYHIDSPGIIN